MPTCRISGQSFEVSELEQQIRAKLKAPQPDKLPVYIFQELASFWQHFALYTRKCDATGEEIISVYDSECPYPVWKRDYWIKNAKPPEGDFQPDKPFSEQLWNLFQHCPIPHNIGTGNENCDYTDDWWYSKNCYLSHSGLRCEDLNYCFRIVGSKDCMYCVFCMNCELCYDLIYSNNCYNVTYALYSDNCRDSAFLFDCQNCSDCLFSWNLRNKQYCIFNKQYTKETYEQEKSKLNLGSRKVYEEMKNKFRQMMQTKAWWKATQIVKSENVTGNYLEETKDLSNCFLTEKAQDCANVIRNYELKDCLNCVSVLSSELVYYSTLTQDHCYDVQFCCDMVNSKFTEYSAHCLNVEYCFGCCGLVNRKYCIFNRQYSPAEYTQRVAEIKLHMEREGVANQFFPKHFAAHPYEDSLAAVYWPLTREVQEKEGWRLKNALERRNEGYKTAEDIPDDAASVTEQITREIFWDQIAMKPFQMTKRDIILCQRLHVPLPNNHYIRRIKENFAWIFFNGTMRETTCALTGKKILTSVPPQFDGRILCEEAYLKEVY